MRGLRLVFCLLLAFSTGIFSAGVSQAEPAPPDYVAPAPLPEPDAGYAQGMVYDIVAATPPELLAPGSEQAAIDWMENEMVRQGLLLCSPYPECLASNPNALNPGNGLAPPPPPPGTDIHAYFDFWKCAGGFAQALASNTLAIAKAFKVYNLIRDLGGVAKIVDRIKDAFYRSATQRIPLNDAVIQVFEESGLGLGAVALELLGVGSVAENCF